MDRNAVEARVVATMLAVSSQPLVQAERQKSHGEISAAALEVTRDCRPPTHAITGAAS